MTGTVDAHGRIAELVAENAKLRRLAYTDDLTGLPNRRVLADCLRQLKSAGRAYTLCLIDLDGFKAINDTYGYAVGDDAIVSAAGRLNEVAEASGAMAARLGGDEFVLVGDLRQVGELVLAGFSDPVDDVGPELLKLTVSVGVCYGGSGDDPARVLHAANLALRVAKTTGRGRLVVFDRAPVGLPVVPSRPKARVRDERPWGER